ncbi:unknown [Clostridium sp. CAG:567]|nr:unknown [Clostridium sp. CAG:567]
MYFAESNCDAICDLKLMLKSSFHPTKVSSVPLYDTNIVLSGIKTVTAKNCLSSSLLNLFAIFVTIIFPNLSDLPIKGISSLSSSQSILKVVLSVCSNLFANSSIVISSFSSNSCSSGKYDNLDNIKPSISLNTSFFKFKSPLHFT